MRRLVFQVPRGRGEEVLRAAGESDGTNLARVEATGPEGPLDLVVVHVSNSQVGPLLDRLQSLEGLRVALAPRGVLALGPPSAEASGQATDVQPRSPVEILMAGLQSVGSWAGFLGYAAAAGVVAWIGLYTNSTYLLTAAMLIAPYAGPAMNAAIATARGDRGLLGRSLLRYVAGLATTVAVAAALSLALGQEIATAAMASNSQVSAVAVLLPLVAGAAGALNLVQSERNSLVSGAAVGVLVAASLAPPAGLIGMAGAIGRWDMARGGLFLLGLQLAGINLAGALVFRAYGLTPRGARYGRGRAWVFPASLAASAAAMAGLLAWQFAEPPELQRSSLSQRLTADVERVVEDDPRVDMVEADVRFTRPRIPGQRTLLGVVYVQRREGVGEPAERIRAGLTRSIQRRLSGGDLGVTPLIDVSVLEAPEG